MRFILLILLFFQVACTSHEGPQPIDTIKIKEVARDIKLPQNLFKELEKEFSEEFKSIGPVFIFMPIQVQFNQNHQTNNVLKDNVLRFELEKGGGQIDLKDVISGTGSFYMSFPAEQFASTIELLHLYYISEAPVKKIQGEDFGLGCGKWIDLKDQFKKLEKPDFLKLNTTEHRHLHVLAGHYVFIFKQTNQIYLTQVTITDSRYSNELCTSLGDVE